MLSRAGDTKRGDVIRSKETELVNVVISYNPCDCYQLIVGADGCMFDE